MPLFIRLSTVHLTKLSPALPGIQWNCSAASGQVLEGMWKEEVMPRTHTGISGANRGSQENLIQDSQFSECCLNKGTSQNMKQTAPYRQRVNVLNFACKQTQKISNICHRNYLQNTYERCRRT